MIALGIITSLLEVVTILAVSEDRLTKIWAGVLGLPAIVAILGTVVYSGESIQTVMMWAHGLAAVFSRSPPCSSCHVLTNNVTTDNVLGALAAYLFIGLAMGLLYAVLESLHPDSYKASSEVGEPWPTSTPGPRAWSISALRRLRRRAMEILSQLLPWRGPWPGWNRLRANSTWPCW